MTTSRQQQHSVETSNQSARARQATFRFHTRALAALGRDLVTNDVVAVMELVKNAYDALATHVAVHIHSDDQDTGDSRLEIVDDGHGMDYSTILDVWCVIATPFRHDRPVTRAGDLSRRVTGEKGLGRLAAARLGHTLNIITRQEGGPPLGFSLDWDKILTEDNLQDSPFDVSELSGDALDRDHGTCVRIGGLRSTWSDEKIADLRESLSRLVSPFATQQHFSISLDVAGDKKKSALKVEAPVFMSHPKYAIRGHVDAEGTISADYRYSPIGSEEDRERCLREPWATTLESIPAADKAGLSPSEPHCGPFLFEVRAWDLTKDDTRDIAEHFGESRQHIRGAIQSHQGISVYRDDVLVLPKADSARDWLGLDLRRVSRVGPRMSTSQLVGYVRITKSDNPLLVDTSDREGLVSNPAMIAFRGLVARVVALLEKQRQEDRMDEKDRGPARDLFAELSATPLVERLEGLRDGGGDMSDAISAAKAFEHDLEKSRAVIARRFGYYNRLAVIGTIAQLVIHEIRNRTTVIGNALRKTGKMPSVVQSATVRRAVQLAKQSIASLEALADRFAPLASRGYRAGRRTSIVEESIARCIDLQQREIRSRRITVERPQGRTGVLMDPGEIDAVFLNLLTNAVYWLGKHAGKRQLRFRIVPAPKQGRVVVSVDDTGPGIRPADCDRVFWPGVSDKPEGMGMGLTVASELVDGHGGRMRTMVPGALGGATFEFDLPLTDGRSK